MIISSGGIAPSQFEKVDGTPYEVKVSCTVWSRGKNSDKIKILPIAISLDYIFKLKYIKFGITNIMAYIFHKTLITNLFFTLLLKLKNKTILKYSILFNIIFTMVFKNKLLFRYIPMKYSIYFEKSVKFGFLIPLLIILLNIILIFFVKIKVKYMKIPFRKKKILIILEKYALYLTFFIPLFFINLETTRILRSSLFLIDCYWFLSMKYFLKTSYNCRIKKLIYLFSFGKTIFLILVNYNSVFFVPLKTILSNKFLDIFF